jgi:hypothetical protein
MRRASQKGVWAHPIFALAIPERDFYFSDKNHIPEDVLILFARKWVGPR